MKQSEQIYEHIIESHQKAQRMNHTGAIDTMKGVLRTIQQAQTECISDGGFIIHKERFAILTGKAKSFKDSIDWMERMYNE